jgi:hypothetical protein
MSSKLFTVAGITKHSAGPVTVNKVRCGTDIIRMIKMLNGPKKIWHTETGQCLSPIRVDLVELPSSMLKKDAAKYIASLPEFQSAEDQLLIQEFVESREPKTPRVKKQKQVKVKGNIDSITNRAKQKLTAEELLAAAFAEEPIQE